MARERALSRERMPQLCRFLDRLAMHAMLGQKSDADCNKGREESIVVHSSGQCYEYITNKSAEYQRAEALQALITCTKQSPSHRDKDRVKQYEPNEPCIVKNVNRRRMR